MYLEDALPLLGIGQTCANFQIKPPRSEQCLIHHVLSICCANHQNIGILVESIHLGKQLIDC